MSYTESSANSVRPIAIATIHECPLPRRLGIGALTFAAVIRERTTEPSRGIDAAETVTS